MSVDTEAKEKVEYFQNKFGQPHLDLAYHLAFPITFTPDLAYQIHAYFRMDSHKKQYLQVPWIAVADLLLSYLCQEVQNETYQMDEGVRFYLLEEMRKDARFGEERLEALAHFLRHYARQQLTNQNKSQRRAARLQDQQALSFLAPKWVIRQLARDLNNDQLREGQARRLNALIDQFLSTAKLSTENSTTLEAFQQLRDYSQIRVRIADPREDSNPAVQELRTRFGDHPILFDNHSDIEEKQPLLSWRRFQSQEPQEGSDPPPAGDTIDAPFGQYIQQPSVEEPAAPFLTPSPTTIPPNGYINFDIHIHTKQGETYPMEASHGYQGGASTGTIQQTFDLEDKEFKDIFLYLRDLVAEPEDARKFGDTLKQMLFPEEIWLLFNRLRQVTFTKQQGIRIRLSIEPPELRALPWEYCYEAERREFLAINLNTPIVRHTKQAFTSNLYITDRQLKILMVIAEPKEISAWDNSKAEKQMSQILGQIPADLIKFEVLKNATIDSLQRTVTELQPHILHFAVDGESKDGEEVIFLEDIDGLKHRVNAIQLTELLHNQATKLVVFEYPVMTIAVHLLQKGIPAIITPQFLFPQNTFLDSNKVLYEELSSNPSIDTIITKMRSDIFQPEGEVFWAIPVLFTNSPDGIIWQRPEQPEIDAEETAAIKHEIERLEAAGLTLQTEGNNQEALQAYQEAVKLRRQTESDPLELLITLNQIGRILLYQDSSDDAQAQTVLEQALVIGREYGQTFVGTADTLALLGQLHFLRDDLEQAEPYLEEAIAKWKELTMGGNEFTAQTYTYLGDLFQATGRQKEAISPYEEALDIRRTIADMSEQPLGRPTSDVLDKLGDLYAEIGEIETALQHYEETHQLYRELLGENDPVTIETRSKLEQLAQQLAGEQAMTYAIVTDTLNMRDMPNTTGRVIGRLQQGDRVLILQDTPQTKGQQTNWSKIRTETGQEGWASSNFLNILPDSPSMPDTPETTDNTPRQSLISISDLITDFIVVDSFASAQFVRNQIEDGKEWDSYIIVNMGEGKYAVFLLGHLIERLTTAQGGTITTTAIGLDQIPSLLDDYTVEGIDISGSSIARARKQALRAPLKMLVAVDGGEAVGVIDPSKQRAFEPRIINVEIAKGFKRFDPSREPLTAGDTYQLSFFLDFQVSKFNIAQTEDIGSTIFEDSEADETDDLTIQLESDDFEIVTNIQSLTVPRTGKSRRTTFNITPKTNEPSTIQAIILKDGAFIQLITLKFGHGTLFKTEKHGYDINQIPSHHRRNLTLLVLNTGRDFQLIMLGPTAAMGTIPINQRHLISIVAELRKEIYDVVHLQASGTKIYQQRIDIPEYVNAHALGRLARAGKNLFNQLFFGPGHDLQIQRIGERLMEMAQGDRMNIQIFSQQFMVPWGFLYVGDVANPQPEMFLGMRHVIEHIPLQSEMRTTRKAIDTHDGISVALNLNIDIDTQMGAPIIGPQLEFWANLNKANSKIKVDVREDGYEVMAPLADGETVNDILYFYCHGESYNFDEGDTNDGQSKLILTGHQEITLEMMRNEGEPLPGRPLVFLNLVESAELSPEFYEGFVSYFADKGARGVIGTEFETPALFAEEWHNRFFAMFLGPPQTIGNIFLELRRDFYYNHNNIMGLLYALYADADIFITEPLLTNETNSY